MYKIIGADGKEYGPITLAQLKQWVVEGRANAQTKVLPEGATEWKTLAEFPELIVAAPVMPSLTPVLPPSETAASQVRGPAIFILVLSILDILASLLGMASAAFNSTLLPTLLPNLPRENIQIQQKFAFLFTLPANVVGLIMAVVCLIGALKMMKLSSYGLALTSAILTMIPCGTCCCLLNIGAGIWALVVLSKPEVKSAFH